MKKIKAWIAVFFFVCTGAGVFLYMREELPYIQAGQDAVRLAENYMRPEKNSVMQSSPERQLYPKIDFSGLEKVNPHIIGWIFIPETQINYPILQHPTEDAYYLTHTPEKKLNKLGSIYMHHDADEGFEDAHTILFGHNMRSGQMFGELSEYRDKAFAKEHPVFICIPGKIMRCRVYSVYDCSVDDLTYTAGYEPGGEYYETFIRHTLERSWINTEEYPSGEDCVITLSTCTDRGEEGRRFAVNCFVTEVWKFSEEEGCKMH